MYIQELKTKRDDNSIIFMDKYFIIKEGGNGFDLPPKIIKIEYQGISKKGKLPYWEAWLLTQGDIYTIKSYYLKKRRPFPYDFGRRDS